MTEGMKDRTVDEAVNRVAIILETSPKKNDERSTEVSSKGTSWFYYRQLAVFCFSLFLVFSAFLPLQNLQSSLNASLGFISLTVVYICFILSTIFSPFLIKVLGPKYVIVACYAAHCFYMVCNYYPEYYTLIPGSVVIGLASGPLWSSAGVYIASQADGVARVLGANPEKYIASFTGIFFWTFFAAAGIGNGVSSAVLLPDAGGLSLHLDFSNVTNASNSSGNGAVCSISSQADISPLAYYLLLSLFLAADVLAFFVSLCCMSRTREMTFSSRTCREVSVQFKRTLIGFMRFLVKPRYLLPAAIFGYQGFNMGMVAGLFSKHYITECVGVGFVGISQIILGIGSGVTSVTVGKMINIVPRSFVVVFGALEDAGFLLFLLLWERVPSLPTIFVVVLLWGIGDGIWNTIPTSYVGIVTDREKQDIAYSLQRFWMAIGFSVNFFVSDYLPVQTNLIIMFGLVAFAVILYVIGDEIQTKSTIKFFKRACCYSSGSYDVSKSSDRRSSLASVTEESIIEPPQHVGRE